MMYETLSRVLVSFFYVLMFIKDEFCKINYSKTQPPNNAASCINLMWFWTCHIFDRVLKLDDHMGISEEGH